MTTPTGVIEQPVTDPSTSSTLVFQCSTCSQIIADSFSWVCSHRQLNSFTVSSGNLRINVLVDLVATKDVIVSETLDTSRDGVDLGRYMDSILVIDGSTTVALTCGKCSTVLGRIYKTTPRWLDGIRYTTNSYNT